MDVALKIDYTSFRLCAFSHNICNMVLKQGVFITIFEFHERLLIVHVLKIASTNYGI